MNSRLALTERDSELLEVLASRVRCLSLRQVTTQWWPAQAESTRNARARLRKLEEAGLLDSGAVLARPLPAIMSPVLTWSPGAAPPDFSPVAYFLQHRFSMPVVSTPVVFATRAAASRYGGQVGRLSRPSEATHDLGLASVYLLFHQATPAKAKCWISEARLVRGMQGASRKVPDALIRTRRGRETVIEFGGEYAKAKLLEFHQDCAERGRSYELW